MRRTLAILLLLTVAAVFAASLVAILRKAPTRVVMLPDGGRLEFLGTTMGNATFSTELPWHRWLRRVLPRKWTGWIPAASSASCSSGTNSITVYVRAVDSNGQPISATPWQGYAAEDDSGFRYPREGGGCSTGGGTRDRLDGVMLRAFPRRQSSFWLRFFNQTNGVMASLRVSNPVRGPFPEWEARPLPQTWTNGPVMLALETLRETGSRPWMYLQPKWKLTATEPAWQEARVRYFTLEDATGNEGSSLSRREPAWKARARVYRERFEDFAASERLVVTNLTIPAAGEFVEIDQSAELSGVLVSVLVLSGAGELLITNGVSRAIQPSARPGSEHSTMAFGNTVVESWQGDKPFLLVEVQRTLPDDEVFIGMFDEKGHLMKQEQEGGWSSNRSGTRVYRRNFDQMEALRSVNLEIVLSRPVGLEFFISPAEVQPAHP